MVDKTKRCKDCWWAQKTYEPNMRKCRWFGNEVYAESLTCSEYADSCPVF